MMDYQAMIDNDLKEILSDKTDDITVQAARYSLLAGGKRLRPKMMYMTSRMFGTDDELLIKDVRYYAVTLEMIHTYSLIHDDLPGMDNDDLRRGKPTCHKVYGEGTATLAGDLLLNSAMERLMKITLDKPQYSYASYKIAELAGICGMIGGQSIDINSEGKEISLDRLYELQEKKTGALFESAVVTPYYLIRGIDQNSAGEDRYVDLLRKLAKHIGLAFQIRDDILDVTSDAATLGKSCGKDERDNKSTFVTLLGYDEARSKLDEEIDRCHKILDEMAVDGLFVDEYRGLTDYLRNRGN